MLKNDDNQWPRVLKIQRPCKNVEENEHNFKSESPCIVGYYVQDLCKISVVLKVVGTMFTT